MDNIELHLGSGNSNNKKFSPTYCELRNELAQRTILPCRTYFGYFLFPCERLNVCLSPLPEPGQTKESLTYHFFSSWTSVWTVCLSFDPARHRDTYFLPSGLIEKSPHYTMDPNCKLCQLRLDYCSL
jgi:hypothetical protein